MGWQPCSKQAHMQAGGETGHLRPVPRSTQGGGSSLPAAQVILKTSGVQNATSTSEPPSSSGSPENPRGERLPASGVGLARGQPAQTWRRLVPSAPLTLDRCCWANLLPGGAAGRRGVRDAEVDASPFSLHFPQPHQEPESLYPVSGGQEVQGWPAGRERQPAPGPGSELQGRRRGLA